jgi:hypothetical protein
MNPHMPPTPRLPYIDPYWETRHDLPPVRLPKFGNAAPLSKTQLRDPKIPLQPVSEDVIQIQKKSMRQTHVPAAKRQLYADEREEAATRESIKFKPEAMQPNIIGPSAPETITPTRSVWRPRRESAAIVIRYPNGEPLDLDSLKLNTSSKKTSAEPPSTLPTVTRSTPRGASSIGTSTNTLKSSTVSGPQSTAPTSILDVESSKERRRGILQEQFAEGTTLLTINEDLEQVVTQDADQDGQSTISSVTMLPPIQRKDIVKKFTEAILKNLPRVSPEPQCNAQSKIPFRHRFQGLLKKYSVQVKNEAGQRTQRQAAKQIRLLRHDISEKFEEAFEDRETRRAYPNIVKQALEGFPPQLTWAEKIREWNEVPSAESPLTEELKGKQGHVGAPRGITLVAEETYLAPNSAALSDFYFTDSSSESEMDEVVHTTPEEDRDIERFLTTHHAFQELIVEVQSLMEHHHNDQMVVIRNRVMLGLRRPMDKADHRHRPPGRHAAMFYLDWDIVSFLQEQYTLGLDQDIGSLLTITGQATDAFMSTVRTYLEYTWPAYPVALLESLQAAIAGYPRGDIKKCKHH